MNEADHKALTLVVKTLYPYQPRYLSIPFSWGKRELMKVTRLNRWDFDKWLLDLQAKTTFMHGPYDFTRAFYFLECDLCPASRLNYISPAQRGEEAFEKGYCSLQFGLRNEYMKAVLAELGWSKDA